MNALFSIKFLLILENIKNENVDSVLINAVFLLVTDCIL